MASPSGGPSVVDASLKQSLALPNAASTTVAVATGFDTQATTKDDFLALCELLFTAPTLNTTILPDTRTMTYNLIASATANLASPTIVDVLLIQTGAGGVGAAGSSRRFRLPTNIGTIGRYVGLQIVSGASTTNASATTATLVPQF